MSRNRFNPVLAWLCLIWFGLCNTLFAGTMVVCRDGHGGSRIEWGCSRTSDGECMKSCGPDVGGCDDNGDQPRPCDDTPTKGVGQFIKVPPRTTHDVPVSAPAILVMVAIHIDAPALTLVVRDRARLQRPPDTLLRLRSVIILV